jgi:hypothetical protein
MHRFGFVATNAALLLVLHALPAVTQPQFTLPTTVPDSAALGGATYQLLANRVENLAPSQRNGADDPQAINQRYLLVGDALGTMRNSLSNINEVLLVAALEQTVGLGTNPWSDENFRNAADRMENWGSSLGLVAAAIAPFLGEGNDQRWLLGGGISLAAVSKLVGSFWGQQTGGKFEEKARFVEFTRQAYDDLRSRNAVTNGYVQSNRALISEIDAFLRTKYAESSSGTTEEKKQILAAASSFLTRFDLALTQIPAMLDLYTQTIENYCPGAINAAAGNPNTLGAFECLRHRTGEPAFRLSGESRQFLLSAAENLVRLRENREAANRIRELTPTLRGALTGQ